MTKEIENDEIVAPIDFAEAVKHIPQGEWRLPSQYKEFRNPYSFITWDLYLHKVFGGIDSYLEKAQHGKKIIEKKKFGTVELNPSAVAAWYITYKVIKKYEDNFIGKDVEEIIGSIRKGISSLYDTDLEENPSVEDIKNTRAFAKHFVLTLY